MRTKVILLMGCVYTIVLIWALIKDLNHINHPSKSNKDISAATKSESKNEIPTDTETGLAIGPGYALIQKHCLSCHSGKLIAQNRGTRTVWKGTIRWMQDTQKLWDLGEDEEPILDYLTKYYASTSKGRRAPLSNLEWYKLSE